MPESAPDCPCDVNRNRGVFRLRDSIVLAVFSFPRGVCFRHLLRRRCARIVAEHPAVVERVVDPGCQIPEHPVQVADAADREPDGTDDRNDAGHDQRGDQKIIAPVFHRPGRNRFQQTTAMKHPRNE